MKKLAAIFLLCIYTLIQVMPTCWYYCNSIAHIYFQHVQQRRALSGYDPEDLITISIDKMKLQELKTDDDEIVINGVLYDIETVVSCGNQTKLLLKRDRGETNWNDQYKKICTQVHKPHGDLTHTIGKIPANFFNFFYTNSVAEASLQVEPLHNAFNNLPARYHTDPIIGLYKPPPCSC